MDRTAMRPLIFALALIVPSLAIAHPAHANDIALPWTWEPWVIACLIATIALYAAGLVRVWGTAGVGRGIARWQAASFFCGSAVVAIALLSPLDLLGSYLFSAHMVQHELLMIVAAPLLVIAKPLAVWSWALPAQFTQTFAGSGANRLLRSTWKTLSFAPCAWLLHGATIWAWHAPSLFDAALGDETVHKLQHLSFFVSALLFWWAPFGATSRIQRGAALVYLFTTMIHTTILGALLTVAPSQWYGAYGDTAELFGLSPLEDQQLGGLIMWVPGGVSYLAASLAIAWQSLKGRDDCGYFQASR